MLGAGLIIGVAILAMASVIKSPVTEKSLDRLSFVGKFGIWASIWLFITGLILYLQEPKEFNGNPWFWTKIGLYAFEGVLSSMVVGRQVKRVRTQLAQNQTPSSGGLASTLTVVAIAILLIASIGVMLTTSHTE